MWNDIFQTGGVLNTCPSLWFCKDDHDASGSSKPWQKTVHPSCTFVSPARSIKVSAKVRIMRKSLDSSTPGVFRTSRNWQIRSDVAKPSFPRVNMSIDNHNHPDMQHSHVISITSSMLPSTTYHLLWHEPHPCHLPPNRKPKSSSAHPLW